MKKIIFDKENEKRPYLAVAAVIIKKVKAKEFILLGKRKNVAGHGYFYLPGGHVFEGEKISDAIKREIKEECGLEIESDKGPIWVDENLEKPHHVTLYYLCSLKKELKPINLEPERCYFWRWYPIDNLPSPLWQNLSDFIKKYRQKKLIHQFFDPSVDYIGAGVAGVILNEKKEVLLQLRGEKARNLRGLWNLPSGQIKWGEKADEALKREIKEELGVEIKIIKPLIFYDGILVNEDQHWLVMFYLCQLKEGKPINKEPRKTEKIAWFSLENLPENLAFGLKEVLKSFINQAF